LSGRFPGNTGCNLILDQLGLDHWQRVHEGFHLIRPHLDTLNPGSRLAG
jgi:hypothetical protein